ncbi:hypothetical protein BM449_07495 [Synechococcus sp. SynAce01]|nr:hypothetical protein BM449_07495 [Synechococcus sp. SynAce01]
MIRWLLIGSMFFGLGTGLRRGWVAIDWCRFLADTNLPSLNSLQPEAPVVCPSVVSGQATPAGR